MDMKVVTFGEVMLRLTTPLHQRFSQTTSFQAGYGGAEANVAVSLANFGIPVGFVTRLPKNEIGEACKMELQKYGVGTDKIIFGGERLGIYFLETGAVCRPSKVIYDRSGSSLSQIEKGMIDWDDVFDGVTWFHWSGITPAISRGASEVCLEAIKKASEKGITISCDLNFRKKLWNYGKSAIEVMPELVSLCDLVMGNEEDAENSLGVKPEGVDVAGAHLEPEAYRSVSEQIMKVFPKVKKVITTLRGSVNASHNIWSGVLYDGDNLLKSPAYQITHIIDRVGGGDSFMGGLIYGLLKYKGNDKKALNFATAASCLKHTVHGDFNLVSVDEVIKLMEGDSSGRVDR